MSQQKGNIVMVSMTSLESKLKEAGVELTYEDSKRLGINRVMELIRKTLQA
jgi:predicted enzyme involved in methoxymalonyl-ACP biosynthesis